MVKPTSIRPRARALCKPFLALSLAATSFSTSASSIFINEIHYDNLGPDSGEAIEIAGRAGADLSGWKLLLYNGLNGKPYRSEDLQGILPEQQAGFGTLVVAFSSGTVQNGSPDGIALVDATDTVIQFLSYEGSFDALEGPASGMGSVDIGVAEAVDTPVGFSLQLTGSGKLPQDFAWAPAQANTFGAVNTGQSFVPIPAALPLFLSAIASVGFFRRGVGKRKL